MFGMGFMEIFLILIVAIMALGPEKLPSAAVDMVKFFKKFKSGIDEAKSTLDNELNISEMKNEANKFKASINEVKSVANFDIDDYTNINDEDIVKPKETIETKPKDIKSEIKVTSKKENISFDQEVKS
ncbi:MAG: Sec-independent protein translocase protein TatB [Campylobacterota bacterium]|nr:Sec-independent protein translocase protein TatB [Campylobacterota bacterium]